MKTSSNKGISKLPQVYTRSYKWQQLIPLRQKSTNQYVPSEEEILQYAQYIGIQIPGDQSLLYIAQQGINAQLPEEWQACQTPDQQMVYRNTITKIIQEDHPLDQYYRKKVLMIKANQIQNYYQSQANQNVDEQSQDEVVLPPIEQDKNQLSSSFVSQNNSKDAHQSFNKKNINIKKGLQQTHSNLSQYKSKQIIQKYSSYNSILDQGIQSIKFDQSNYNSSKFKSSMLKSYSNNLNSYSYNILPSQFLEEYSKKLHQRQVNQSQSKSKSFIQQKQIQNYTQPFLDRIDSLKDKDTKISQNQKYEARNRRQRPTQKKEPLQYYQKKLPGNNQDKRKQYRNYIDSIKQSSQNESFNDLNLVKQPINLKNLQGNKKKQKESQLKQIQKDKKDQQIDPKNLILTLQSLQKQKQIKMLLLQELKQSNALKQSLIKSKLAMKNMQNKNRKRQKKKKNYPQINIKQQKTKKQQSDYLNSKIEKYSKNRIQNEKQQYFDQFNFKNLVF